MFLGRMRRLLWLAPTAGYMCLVSRLTYLFAFRHATGAFDALAIVSLPSSLLAQLITDLLLGDANGGAAVVGSFTIVVICGIAQYLAIGLVLRALLGDFLTGGGLNRSTLIDGVGVSKLQEVALSSAGSTKMNSLLSSTGLR
jgi:hypothetical protein